MNRESNTRTRAEENIVTTNATCATGWGRGPRGSSPGPVSRRRRAAIPPLSQIRRNARPTHDGGPMTSVTYPSFPFGGRMGDGPRPRVGRGYGTFSRDTPHPLRRPVPLRRGLRVLPAFGGLRP